MKIWKSITALSLAVIMTAAAGLPLTLKAQAKEPDKVVVSRVVTGENGKSYVEVDGKPFMYENVECMGTWLLKGFDASTIKGYKDPLPLSWMENVFEKTAQAGYNTVSTFFCWSDMEPDEEGEYDWTILDQYLEWAEKYNLRLSLTWFGSDAGGGTRLPGYGAGWSCHVPQYLCNQEKYWNRRAVPEDAYRHETRFRCIPGTEEGDYIKECEKNALIALTEHLRDHDKTHRMISLMINNESQNIPDSWHTELAQAVKSVGYDFVIGQHMQKSQYKYREGYDFVGFDDYSTDLDYKLSYLNNSPTPLKACLETGGNANNLSSQVLAGITNGGWVQAWQLCDAYSDCNQLGMFETPDGVYPKFTDGVSEQAGQEYDTVSKPDYLTWEVGKEETLKYGAEKNRRLQVALRKAYWTVAQAAPDEMLSFNLESDEPEAGYTASKELNGHTFGFISDGPDSVRGKGSNGMIASRDDEYFCLSDTGTEVTFVVDSKPLSAEYGHQDGYEENEEGTGEWVKEGDAQIEEQTAKDGTKTWAVTCRPEQVLRIQLNESNASPVFTDPAFEKTVVKNVPVSGTAQAVDGNYADTVTYSIKEKPRHGTAKIDPLSGEWTYTPDTDWYGEESFTIAASDGRGGEGLLTVAIHVKEKSSVPVFEQPTIELEIPKDTVTGGVCKATDADEGDTQTYSAAKAPEHGSLTVRETGEWCYIPAGGYTGADSFGIRVTDSYGETADMTAEITVRGEEAGTGANLSLGEEAAVQASSSYPKNLADYAIDGDVNTLWSPKNGNLPQTLTVDLGGIHELNAVQYQIAANASYEWNYKIEGSKDSVSWEVLADREAAGPQPGGNTKVSEQIEGQYRYIRWTVTGTTSSRDTVSTREFEIWGNEEVISADAATPEITTQPVSGEYTYGESIEPLTVKAQTDDGGILSYQWYKNTEAATDGSQLIPGATDPSYTPSGEQIGTTYYYCHVTNRNDNVSGIAEVPADSSIAAITVNKAPGTGKVSIQNWVYGEEPSAPAAESETNGTENVIYLYKVKDAEDSTYTETVPSEIGDYTVKAVFPETEFYKETSATADFSIVEVGTSTEVPVTGIALDVEKLELQVGESRTITASVFPEDATEQTVTWSSGNNEIVQVDESGNVTANAEGTALITATTKDGNFTASCLVTVKETEPVKVSGVTISTSELTLKEGEAEKLEAVVTPEDAENQTVFWSSSDSSIAQVDKEGTVSGVKAGTSVITVSTQDGGYTAQCKVTVEAGTSENPGDTGEPGDIEKPGDTEKPQESPATGSGTGIDKEKPSTENSKTDARNNTTENHEKNISNSVKTGDNTNIIGLIVVMTASACIFLYVILHKARKSRNK